jgi:60 kDa SS-A/Ro ribonucleoprotein
VSDNVFLAKLAVHRRQRAMMKDMPVALLVVLSKRDPVPSRKAFDGVVDNGRTRSLENSWRRGD